MHQSRLISLTESVTNVGVGFAISLVTQFLAFPLFGLRLSIGENLVLVGIFTSVSTVRTYALRRLFEVLI